jgi:hypothetical protein
MLLLLWINVGGTGRKDEVIPSLSLPLYRNR